MSNLSYIYGYHAIHAALICQPQQIKQIYANTKRQDQRASQLALLAEQHGVTWVWASADELRALLPKTDQGVHQGFVATCVDQPYYQQPQLAGFLSQSMTQPNAPLLLVLEGIQDPHNLGACLRSANAFNVQAVVIPKHRAASITPAVRKVASGAAETLPIFQVTNISRTLVALKDLGIWLVGTDVDATMTVDELDLTGPIALVLGNEQTGLRQLTKKHCDFLVKIPMQGTVQSLNVSVATAVCLYEVQRQRNQPR